MIIIGMIIMWAGLAVFYAVLSKWHIGGEYDQRQKYWATCESK